MSELASDYYRKRARNLGIESPSKLLDGQPVQLATTDDQFFTRHLSAAFAEKLQSVESFALDGVRGAYRNQGHNLSESEWQAIRTLPYSNRLRSARRYAEEVVVPAATKVFTLHSGEIFLEAIARSEIPDKAWPRVIRDYYSAREPVQEPAQVFLLTRTMSDERRQCVGAHVTIIWGEHFDGRVRIPNENYLTPRYMGAALLSKEIASLPPLQV